MGIKINYSFPKDYYTGKAVFGWGNFIHHTKQVGKGSLGHRVVHGLVATAELLPGIGQLISMVEVLILDYLTDKAIESERKLQNIKWTRQKDACNSKYARFPSQAYTIQSAPARTFRSQLPAYTSQPPVPTLRAQPIPTAPPPLSLQATSDVTRANDARVAPTRTSNTLSVQREPNAVEVDRQQGLQRAYNALGSFRGFRNARYAQTRNWHLACAMASQAYIASAAIGDREYYTEAASSL